MVKCSKHPKYLAKRYPTSECGTCLSMYLQRKAIRKPTAPPKRVHPDKTKYNRKKLHENDPE